MACSPCQRLFLLSCTLYFLPPAHSLISHTLQFLVSVTISLSGQWIPHGCLTAPQGMISTLLDVVGKRKRREGRGRGKRRRKQRIWSLFWMMECIISCRKEETQVHSVHKPVWNYAACTLWRERKWEEQWEPQLRKCDWGWTLKERKD